MPSFSKVNNVNRCVNFEPLCWAWKKVRCTKGLKKLYTLFINVNKVNRREGTKMYRNIVGPIILKTALICINNGHIMYLFCLVEHMFVHCVFQFITGAHTLG